MATKKPKRPKRPKASATIKSWEKFDDRMRNWDKRCKQIEADKKKKETLQRKYR